MLAAQGGRKALGVPPQFCALTCLPACLQGAAGTESSGALQPLGSGSELGVLDLEDRGDSVDWEAVRTAPQEEVGGKLGGGLPCACLAWGSGLAQMRWGMVGWGAAHQVSFWVCWPSFARPVLRHPSLRF